MVNMSIDLMQDDITDAIIYDIMEHNWSLSACETIGYYEDIKNNILNTVDRIIDDSNFNYYTDELRTIVFNYLINTEPEKLTQMLDITEFVKTLIEIYYEDCYNEALEYIEAHPFKELD